MRHSFVPSLCSKLLDERLRLISEIHRPMDLMSYLPIREIRLKNRPQLRLKPKEEIPTEKFGLRNILGGNWKYLHNKSHFLYQWDSEGPEDIKDRDSDVDENSDVSQSSDQTNNSDVDGGDNSNSNDDDEEEDYETENKNYDTEETDIDNYDTEESDKEKTMIEHRVDRRNIFLTIFQESMTNNSDVDGGDNSNSNDDDEEEDYETENKNYDTEETDIDNYDTEESDKEKTMIEHRVDRRNIFFNYLSGIYEWDSEGPEDIKDRDSDVDENSDVSQSSDQTNNSDVDGGDNSNSNDDDEEEDYETENKNYDTEETDIDNYDTEESDKEKTMIEHRVDRRNIFLTIFQESMTNNSDVDGGDNSNSNDDDEEEDYETENKNYDTEETDIDNYDTEESDKEKTMIEHRVDRRNIFLTIFQESMVKLGSLDQETSALFICDLQEKFSSVISHFPQVIENTKKLAHVCVEQTAIDLVSRGFTVHVVADCCSSRSQEDRFLAFQRLKQIGCYITTSETVLFKLLKGKDHPKFKEVAALVKTTSQPTELVSTL
ncbi:Isochorismatase domain-containing protein 1 [Armadillidium vulgare]|nr:Isochorismatase domain-containing protein 1 [Armadillidium vulgare]